MLANTRLLLSIEALLCSLKFLLRWHEEDEEKEEVEKFRRRTSSHHPLPACARNRFHSIRGMGTRCRGELLDGWLQSQVLPVTLEKSL